MQTLAKELESSNFGVICLTRDNLSSPWILFEAGSLAKSLEGCRVIPLLLDIEFSEISGPLAQFQAKKVDRAGLSEAVQSLNQASTQPIPGTRLSELFDALWPKFDKQVTAIAKSAAQPGAIRPQHEILEELVASVRSLRSDRDLLVEVLTIIRRQDKQKDERTAVQQEILRTRSQRGQVTQNQLRELVQALGKELEATNREVTEIYIEVQGEYKELKNGMPLFCDFSGGDFVAEFTRRTRLDPKEFGKGWLFKDEMTGHILTEEESRDPASYFQTRKPRIILEIRES
ncbi:MAG TPA: hypothetical protein VF173_31850 [Thermoanaerobaculia bacterium]|nr:hypothetical protein [Thermoanaerobaculia bacterium]